MLFDQISLHFACNFWPTMRVPLPTMRLPVLFSCDINAQILSGLPGRLYFEKKHSTFNFKPTLIF